MYNWVKEGMHLNRLQWKLAEIKYKKRENQKPGSRLRGDGYSLHTAFTQAAFKVKHTMLICNANSLAYVLGPLSSLA